MTIGDLVKVHWGNCNWEGEEGVDWGYSAGVIIGDIVKVNQSGSYCEVTEIHKSEAHSHGGGHVWVEILDTGDEATFCLDEVEVISESR